MIATSTYGRRVSALRLGVIVGWFLLGLIYVTGRALIGGALTWLRAEAPRSQARRIEPNLFPQG